jgi:hypothetical protein
MCKPQISGQTGSLTRAGVKTSARNENMLAVTPRYGGAHSLPYSSSVPDPSHSPSERGQGHGVRERVWKKVGRCGVCMEVGGGWLGKGNGIGNGSMERSQTRCVKLMVKEVQWLQSVN